MHRTHSTPCYGVRLVEFHKSNGIGDGRGGPREPLKFDPPQQPGPRWGLWLRLVAVLALALLFALWILFCAGFLGVEMFGNDLLQPGVVGL